MKLPPTAWMAICMLGGLIALVCHAILTFGSALGAGLGSTQESPVPRLANQLWAAALVGTLIVGLLLVVLMIRYRMVWWRLYAAGWIVVTACLWAGSWVNAGGYPAHVAHWLLVDLLLAAITVGSGWYALRHYPREYFQEQDAMK